MDATNTDEMILVFIVDDDAVQRAVLRRWLRAEGHRVVEFDGGESCLAGLDTILPDAVVLDMHMHGLSGLETLSVLRAAHPEVPVLMLTADDDVDTLMKAKQLGISDYILKPADRLRVCTKVREAVAASRALQALG